MREWQRTLVDAEGKEFNYTIQEKDFDHDLHQFLFTTADGNVLGVVTPADASDTADIVKELDEGSDPITEGWEDGMGNTVSMAGWGK